jgi:hypothetical protein
MALPFCGEAAGVWSPSSSRFGNREVENISKCEYPLLKVDAVLALVGEVLGFVPFEPEAGHGFSIFPGCGES